MVVQRTDGKGTVFGRMLGRKQAAESEYVATSVEREKQSGEASGSGKSEGSTASNTDSDEPGDASHSQSQNSAPASVAGADRKGAKGKKWTFF